MSEPATLPDATRVLEALDATWPAATTTQTGGWTIREGRGGGSRVSAATALDPAADIAAAEAAMAALHQTALFMVRPQDEALDQALSDRGYRIKDPVTLMAATTTGMSDLPVPPVTSFQVWPPIAAQIEIWEQAGIGPARLAVMHRVTGPKTSFLGRTQEAPAGTAFCAVDGKQAMLHALEISPAHRRKGLGGFLMGAAARWAARQGATHLSLAVTKANANAIGLYTSLGMRIVGEYHYRIAPDDR